MPSDHQHFFEGDAAEDAGDFEAARASFERGAADGDPFCWSRLGLMFDNGVGCDVDKVAAMQCYRRAWRLRDVVAANNIAILYREGGNNRAAFRWFERAADAGDTGAHVELAKCYATGSETRKSLKKAEASLHLAINGRLSEAEREEAELLLTRLQK